LRAVQAHLPVANCCGQCEDCAREIIADHKVAATRAVAA
jgi:bacterioferritin-associated ferredoxin